jgi:arylsulfatase A-like enzyme
MISPFGQRHAAWHFYAGFNEIHNTGRNGMESAEEVTPTVKRWLDTHGQEDNWYLHINYWDIHTPYRAPESYGDPFSGDPLPDWLTEETLETHKQLVGPHTPLEISMWDDKVNPNYPRHPGLLDTMDDLRRMIDGYDTAIRYVDDQLAVIFKLLEQKGILDDTAIIISADHGENMGELGIYGEHGTADQATCHIPLIIRWPGARAGTVDTGLHYHLDLAPTVAELIGGEKQPLWDGDSYAQAVTGSTDCGRRELIISQCAHVCQRSVLFDDWIYLRTYHDGYHLYPREMLFNLKRDPYEQHDIAVAHPDVCREGAYRLMNWQDHMMETMPRPYDNDPLWTVMQEGGPMHTWGALEDYCKRLERTGRAEGAARLRQKYGTSYRHP